jgi:hypothetical protein
MAVVAAVVSCRGGCVAWQRRGRSCRGGRVAWRWLRGMAVAASWRVIGSSHHIAVAVVVSSWSCCGGDCRRACAHACAEVGTNCELAASGGGMW